jgi:NAD(P)-dependent dehydrogenase (short-subunit alcohol dehydrogenase family)
MAKNIIQTFDLSDKIIVITGGYGYLGEGIVNHLLYYNATVVVAARSEAKFKQTFSKQQNVVFQLMDVSDEQSIIDALDTVHKNYGSIDALINNAFYLRGSSPEFMGSDDFNHGIDGTLNSVFRCIKSIIPYFKNQKQGKIVNVASMYGVQAPDFSVYDESPQFINPPHYGAAKAGVIQLTKYYSSYLGQFGINVNTVTPGPFPSLSVQENTIFIEDLKKKTALGKIGFPEDLAGIFTFLVSDAANFVTGQNFIIDGGWTIK